MLSLKKIFKKLLFEERLIKGWFNFKTKQFIVIPPEKSQEHIQFAMINPTLFGFPANFHISYVNINEVEQRGWIAIYLGDSVVARMQIENDQVIKAIQELIQTKHLKPHSVYIDLILKNKSFDIPYDDFMVADSLKDLRNFEQ